MHASICTRSRHSCFSAKTPRCSWVKGHLTSNVLLNVYKHSDKAQSSVRSPHRRTMRPPRERHALPRHHGRRLLTTWRGKQANTFVRRHLCSQCSCTEKGSTYHETHSGGETRLIAVSKKTHYQEQQRNAFRWRMVVPDAGRRMARRSLQIASHTKGVMARRSLYPRAAQRSHAQEKCSLGYVLVTGAKLLHLT